MCSNAKVNRVCLAEMRRNMERRQPVSGEFYRHFKGGLYQIRMLGKNSETRQWMVVYQGMYPPYECWVRDLQEFMEPVDREKYPGCSQEYRFEKVDVEKLQEAISVLEENRENAPGKEEDTSGKDVHDGKAGTGEVSRELFRKAITSGQPQRYLRDTMTDEQVAERGFLELLDAETFREKRQIFIGMRDYLTPLLISNIAVALDIVLEEGDQEAQYESVLRCMQAFEHYEGGRLR